MTVEPQSARDRHASDPWCLLRLLGLRQIETRHGVAWSARITHDGVDVGWVEDLGQGGPIDVRWTDPAAQGVAREVSTRLAGQTGEALGDPEADLLDKLAAVHDLNKHRALLWRIPSQDGVFWDDFRYRSFPTRVTRTAALTYLQHPDRRVWAAEVWDRDRAWWTPVAETE